MERQRPNLIIAGVSKCGTTSTFRYLSEHPDIFPASKKEVSYFKPLRFNKELKPWSVYESYFKGYGGEQYCMEASTTYFAGGRKIAKYMKENLGHLKVMLFLRNPVDRMFSLYSYHKGELRLNKDITFSEYIRMSEKFNKEMLYKSDEKWIYSGIASGKYADFIEDWLDAFGTNLGVFFFEDLKKDNRNFIRKMCEWLAVDSSFYDNYNFVVENKTRQAKNKMLHKVVLQLNEKFEEFFIKHYHIKEKLRGMYYAFNKSDEKLIVSVEERKYLLELFRPNNTKFYQILKRHGYSYFPDWNS